MGRAAESLKDVPTVFLPAYAQRELLAKRKISALELLELHLDQVQKQNPSFNAVVALDEEGARQQAKAADKAVSGNSQCGPLHGLPMTIKDSFEVVGMPATCGLEVLRGYRPQQDATAVACIRRAGAVIFGKTNLPAGAADHQSCNSLFGLTRNPWNVSRTVGGSSGGSACALAAGMTSLELGSDIGGSIRVPSHFCGVYGHKPSYGIVPAMGHIPPPPGVLSQPELGVVGPMARSAIDLEILLDTIVAQSELAPKSINFALPPSRTDDLRKFRVAVWVDSQAFSLDSSYASAIEAFVEDLKKLGVQPDLKARPAIDAKHSFNTYMTALFAIIGAGVPEAERNAILGLGESVNPASYEGMIALAFKQTYAQYLEIAELRKRIMVAWQAFFRNYDVLICPVTPTVAFPHDIERMDLSAQFGRRTIVDGRKVPYLDNLQWPGLVTVANLPATAMPTRRLVGGLPAGVQIVGPYLEDKTTLKFAQLLEKELGGFVSPSELPAM